MNRTPVRKGAQKHKNTTSIKIIVINTRKTFYRRQQNESNGAKKTKIIIFASVVVFFAISLPRFHSIFIFISLFFRLFRALICYFNDYYCCCSAHYSYYYEIHRLILIFSSACATLKRMPFLYLCDASMHFAHGFLRFGSPPPHVLFLARSLCFIELILCCKWSEAYLC